MANRSVKISVVLNPYLVSGEARDSGNSGTSTSSEQVNLHSKNLNRKRSSGNPIYRDCSVNFEHDFEVHESHHFQTRGGQTAKADFEGKNVCIPSHSQ
jgi:hypothetical protein